MTSSTKTIREIECEKIFFKIFDHEYFPYFDKRYIEFRKFKQDIIKLLVSEFTRISHQSRLQTIKEIEKEVIGENTDIAKVLNPNGTAAGQQYPGLVDLPSQEIVHALEGINQYKTGLRSKLSKLKEQ